MGERTCCKVCKQEFQAQNFLLQHGNPKTFVQFQFGCQSFYLVWRICWALYHIAWIIVSGVRADMWAGADQSQYVKWFIFLTDWAYFILTSSTLVDAIVVTYVFFARNDIRRGTAVSLPWYLRADWCLFNMGNVISVTTSLAYWAIVYDGKEQMTSVNIVTHVVNAVYVIINISVTGMPKRILHFWFSVLVGLVYTLFSLFYHLAGGTNHNNNPYIYPALDWRKPGTAIMYCAIVTFVAVPIVHLLLYGIHNIKMIVYKKCKCSRTSTSPDAKGTSENSPIDETKLTYGIIPK